ncbi:helix-turn-helix domain-containing protein [Eisenbergiella sp.]
MVSFEQAVKLVSVNPSYLIYLFKKETGITFLQYLTNIRMQKACQLMQKITSTLLPQG